MPFTNFNTALGFPYGVFDARNAANLYDEIEMQGTDVTEQKLIEDLEKEIQEVLERYGHVRDGVALDMAYDAMQEMDEYGDDGIHEYEYSDGDANYFLTELGGAPIVYVTASKWIACCATCSPCIPGAGDLDTPALVGSWALCPDPKTMQEMANATGRTYLVAKVSEPEAVITISPEEEL